MLVERACPGPQRSRGRGVCGLSLLFRRHRHPEVIGARSTGRLRGQVPGKAVEHLGGAFLAQRRCLHTVDAVQGAPAVEWRANIRKGLAAGDYDDRPLVKARFGLQFTTYSAVQGGRPRTLVQPEPDPDGCDPSC